MRRNHAPRLSSRFRCWRRRAALPPPVALPFVFVVLVLNICAMFKTSPRPISMKACPAPVCAGLSVICRVEDTPSATWLERLPPASVRPARRAFLAFLLVHFAPNRAGKLLQGFFLLVALQLSRGLNRCGAVAGLGGGLVHGGGLLLPLLRRLALLLRGVDKGAESIIAARQLRRLPRVGGRRPFRRYVEGDAQAAAVVDLVGGRRAAVVRARQALGHKVKVARVAGGGLLCGVKRGAGGGLVEAGAVGLFLHAAHGFARREYLHVLAVPRQSDIGGGAAPLRRMANIGLVKGAALASVDGSRIAKLKLVKLARLGVLANGKGYALGLLPLRGVERHGDARRVAGRVDLRDGADAAIR